MNKSEKLNERITKLNEKLSKSDFETVNVKINKDANLSKSGKGAVRNPNSYDITYLLSEKPAKGEFKKTLAVTKHGLEAHIDRFEKDGKVFVIRVIFTEKGKFEPSPRSEKLEKQFG